MSEIRTDRSESKTARIIDVPDTNQVGNIPAVFDSGITFRGRKIFLESSGSYAVDIQNKFSIKHFSRFEINVS